MTVLRQPHGPDGAPHAVVLTPRDDEVADVDLRRQLRAGRRPHDGER